MHSEIFALWGDKSFKMLLSTTPTNEHTKKKTKNGKETSIEPTQTGCHQINAITSVFEFCKFLFIFSFHSYCDITNILETSSSAKRKYFRIFRNGTAIKRSNVYNQNNNNNRNGIKKNQFLKW